MANVKKYVITGGPGSGKSTLIKALERKGFTIIKETAKEVIFKEKEKGVHEPWLDKSFPDFQRKIFELQLMKETKISSDIEMVFMDRGVPDSLAYYKHRNFKPPQELIDVVDKCNYEKIFFLEPLPLHEKTEYRAEDEKEAKKISKIIKKTYENLGYDLVIISSVNLEERADIILKNL